MLPPVKLKNFFFYFYFTSWVIETAESKISGKRKNHLALWVNKFCNANTRRDVKMESLKRKENELVQTREKAKIHQAWNSQFITDCSCQQTSSQSLPNNCVTSPVCHFKLILKYPCIFSIANGCQHVKSCLFCIN